MAASRIVINPFFDGNAGQPRRGYGQRTADDEVFAGQDTRGNALSSSLVGRSISAVLPSNTTGGKGRLSNMLVEPSTEGGTPCGFSPNIMDDIPVTIDPHIAGESVSLNLGHLRRNAVHDAFAAASQEVTADGTLEMQRLRASATFHLLADPANGYQTGHVQEAAAPSLPPREAYPQVAPPMQHGAQPRVSQTVAGTPSPQTVQSVTSWGGQSPLSAIRRAEQPVPTAMQPALLQSNQHAIALPDKRVIFEYELSSANGRYEMRHETAFHDVLRIPGFLVLLWDTACQNAQKYVIPEGENAPPMAVLCEGDTQAYLVHTTPIRYVHRGFEHTVLIIDKSFAIPQEAGTP